MSECLRMGTVYRHNEPPMTPFILGGDMEAGTAVAKSKSSKGVIIKADANDPGRMPCIGALYNSGLTGQQGNVVHFGLQRSLKRDADFDNGHYIYVSATPGVFTKTQPPIGQIQIVGQARDGCSAVLFALPVVESQIPGYVTLGNHTIVAADLTNEKTFAAEGDDDEYSCPRNGVLYISFDMSALVADDPITVTARAYHMVDGETLKRGATNWWNSAVDDPIMHLALDVTSGKTIQLSLQCSKQVGGDRAVNHTFIMEG